MTRSTLLALAAMSVLGACVDAHGSYVASRADNDMLRFSASNYVLTREDARQYANHEKMARCVLQTGLLSRLQH